MLARRLFTAGGRRYPRAMPQVRKPGQCRECSQPPEAGRARCVEHAEAEVAAVDGERVDKHRCVVCAEPAAPGRTCCRVHLYYYRMRDRARKSALRRAWNADAS